VDEEDYRRMKAEWDEIAGTIVPPILIGLGRVIYWFWQCARWFWNLLRWLWSLFRLLLPRNLAEIIGALKPYGRVVSALGFAIAFGTFLWKDLVIDDAKDQLHAIQKAGIDYAVLEGIDTIRYAALRDDHDDNDPDRVPDIASPAPTEDAQITVINRELPKDLQIPIEKYTPSRLRLEKKGMRR
jgi:hypothetical protein